MTALEMTQCLLEALKNYEVELTIKKEVDDSQPTKVMAGLKYIYTYIFYFKNKLIHSLFENN